MEKNSKPKDAKEVRTQTSDNFCCDKHEHHGGFGAIFLITIGALLLFNNFGLLPWNIWENLWKFWPILLVIAGIETIFGRSWFGNLIVTMIGLSISWLIVANVLSITVPEFNTWLTKNFPQTKIEALQTFLIEKGVK